jgi:hypothetical protein
MGNFISLLKAIGYESEMEQLLPPIPHFPYSVLFADDTDVIIIAPKKK